MQHIFLFHRYQFVIRNIQPCILVHVWVARETKVATETCGRLSVIAQYLGYSSGVQQLFTCDCV